MASNTVSAPAAAEANNQTAPLLSVRNLETYFFADEGVTKAVDGASFDVYPGRTLGIVGESGCGKSVTARSILRIVEHPGRIVGGEILLRQTGGKAVAGQGVLDLTKLPQNSKAMRAIRGDAISLIFQEPMTSFSPVHTIGNQIVEAIRIHRRVSKQEARNQAVELLRRVGISRPEARLDEYAFQMSGGLRQRAMIAMALSCDPVLLIADEPTTALDVTTQAQILELLQELQQQNGMAIILITHNLGVVAETADDVVVMYLGRAVEQGPVDAIFYEPKHPYTKSLLRSIPSVDAPPREPLPTIAGTIPHPFNRPPGCPFHPRCPSFMPGTCDKEEPAMRDVGPRQDAACFLYPDTARRVSA
jgi:peptide/nickel transport system ATP-binding protein